MQMQLCPKELRYVAFFKDLNFLETTEAVAPCHGNINPLSSFHCYSMLYFNFSSKHYAHRQSDFSNMCQDQMFSMPLLKWRLKQIILHCIK